MTKKLSLFLLLIFFAACSPAADVQVEFKHFVHAEGDRLIDGNREYQFISFNIPNLHMIEDQMPFDEINAWRLPDSYELNDALESVAQMGGQVVRIYTITLKRPDDLPGTPKHVLSPASLMKRHLKALII